MVTMHKLNTTKTILKKNTSLIQNSQDFSKASSFIPVAKKRIQKEVDVFEW